MSAVLYGRTHIDGSYRCAVARQGPKWLQVVFFADGGRLKLKRVRSREARYFKPVSMYGSASKMARKMLSAKGDHSKGAKRLLREVVKPSPPASPSA